MEATRRNRCWTHASTEEFVRHRAQSGQLRIVDMKVKDAAQHRIVSSSGLGVLPLRVESLDEAVLVLLPDELRRPSSPESQSEHRTRPKSKAISVEAFPTDAAERAKAKHKMLQAMNPDHAVE